MQVDATKLRQVLSKQLFQRIVAASELVLVHIDGLAVIVRITDVHNLDEEARQEAVSYHCYRGLVTPDTIISLVEEGETLTYPDSTLRNTTLHITLHRGDPASWRLPASMAIWSEEMIHVLLWGTLSCMHPSYAVTVTSPFAMQLWGSM